MNNIWWQHRDWVWRWGPGLDINSSSTAAPEKGCLAPFSKMQEPWQMMKMPPQPSIAQDLLPSIYLQAVFVFCWQAPVAYYPGCCGSHKAFVLEMALENALPHTLQKSCESMLCSCTVFGGVGGHAGACSLTWFSVGLVTVWEHIYYVDISHLTLL